MLCYRCGSHNKDGSSQCENCGQVFTQSLRNGHKKSVKIAASKTAPFQPKDKVAGRYEIVSLLGHGPSGHVYRVIDHQTPPGADRELALKVIHARLLQTPQDRQVFQKSLARTRKMAHPGIARVFNDGEDRGHVFFTMQLLAGLPLSRIIELRQGEKAFTLRECEPMITQLAAALDYSHRFTAHGALKPENVMVLPDEVKITDFMILRGLPRRPYLAALGAGLSYVAPELRVDGADVQPASDVFSLGVILAEMLTGARPDTTKARLELATPKGEDLTPQIRAFLLKAMDTAPDRRWVSPNELLQALASLVDEPMSEPVVISSPKPQPLPPPLAKAETPPQGLAVAPPPPLPSVRGGFDEPEDNGPETAATDLLEEIEAEPESGLSRQETGVIGQEPLVMDDEPTVHESGSAELENTFDDDLVDDDEHPRSSLIRRREDRLARRKKSSRVSAAILSVGVMLACAVVWARTQHPVWFDRVSAPVVTFVHGVTGGSSEAVAKDTALSDAAPPTAASMPEAPPSAADIALDLAAENVPSSEPVKVEPPPRDEPTPTSITAPPVAPPIVSTPTPAPAPTVTPKRDRPEPKEKKSGLEKLPPIEKTQPSSLDAPLVAETKDKFGCRAGMVFVPGGRFSMGSSPSDEYHNFSDKLLSAVDVRPFCVDRYEFPNQSGAAPLVNVSFKQAKQFCENTGKRLCAEDEWERACKGPAGTRFPYGNEFEEGTCNVGKDDSARGLRASGAQSHCRSGFGVVDMSGNAAEWTSSPMAGGDFITKGGDAAHPDFASRCANRSALSGGKRSGTVGFRCCADPE